MAGFPKPFASVAAIVALRKTSMTVKSGILAAIGVFLGSVATLTQSQSQTAHPMTFFVTSATEGSGNLGGIEGADRICQSLAAAVGAANRTWHAYLSQSEPPQANAPAINARDRIGPGPWYNAKGVLIAANVADLHGDVERDRNNIQKTTALNEKGEPIKGEGDRPNQHAVLTGSDSEGRAFPTLVDATCNNWTAGSDTYHAILGHSDRSGGVNVSWNSVHASLGCSKEAFARTGGAGLFYCFAIN
jgi:hypothetical protein